MWWLLETNRLPADQVKLLKVAGLEKTRLSALDRLKRKKTCWLSHTKAA